MPCRHKDIPVLVFVSVSTGKVGKDGNIAFMVLFTIAAALLLHLAVESPWLQIRKGLLSKQI